MLFVSPESHKGSNKDSANFFAMVGENMSNEFGRKAEVTTRNFKQQILWIQNKV